QLGFIMDAACEVIRPALALYLNDDLRTLPDGTLDPRDANAIQSELYEKLANALLRTTPQHVSAIQVVVDRNTNIQSTRTLKARYRIQPKSYAKFVEGEVGYAATLSDEG